MNIQESILEQTAHDREVRIDTQPDRTTLYYRHCAIAHSVDRRLIVNIARKLFNENSIRYTRNGD